MITVDPATHIIFVPQSYLTLVSGTLYTLDTNQFRLDLKAYEATFDGMVETITHIHNTEVTVAGTTFARTVEIIAPYSVEFEDGQYSVRLEGSNNNIFDIEGAILVQNQVQVIPTNSAGNISGQRTLDLLEADEEYDNTNKKYRKLKKGTTDVILEKDYIGTADQDSSLKD